MERIDRKKRFAELRTALGLPLEGLARKLGLSYGSVKAYAAPSRRVSPPEHVIEDMERMVLQASVERVMAAGYDVVPRKQAV